MAASEMAYRWETPGSVWMEDESSAQFELASSEGLSRIEIAPLVLEADAVRDRIRREREFWGPIVAASGFNPDE